MNLPMPSADRAAALLEMAHDVGQAAPIRASSAMPGLAGLAGFVTEDAVCAEHGAYTRRGRQSSGGMRWSICPSCAAVAQAEHEARAAREAELAAKVERDRRESEALAARIGMASIPRRFAQKSFGQYVATSPAQVAALTAAREFADAIDERIEAGQWLLMIGNPGTGKSHLCSAILRAAAARHRVQYTTAHDLVAILRDTWRRNSEMTYMQALRLYGSDLDLLVIDEAGLNTDAPESERVIVHHVLDHRYRNMRATIIASNLRWKELAAHLGERVASRLSEVGVSISFAWGDYRGGAGA